MKPSATPPSCRPANSQLAPPRVPYYRCLAEIQRGGIVCKAQYLTFRPSGRQGPQGPNQRRRTRNRNRNRPDRGRGGRRHCMGRRGCRGSGAAWHARRKGSNRCPHCRRSSPRGGGGGEGRVGPAANPHRGARIEPPPPASSSPRVVAAGHGAAADLIEQYPRPTDRHSSTLAAAGHRQPVEAASRRPRRCQGF